MKFILPTSLLLACLFAPGAARADILFRGDFETGDLSQWQSQLNLMTGQRTNITVVQSPVFEGANAAKIVLHPDDLWPNGHNRVELHQNGVRTGEGQDMFFAFSFYLPEEAQEHNDIGYFETNTSYQQSMAWYVDPNAGKTTIGFRTNRPQGMEHWKTELTTATWHHLAVRIRWSENAAQGLVSLWFDGLPVVTDVSAKTKPDGNTLFFQLGYHRNESKIPVETIYIDRVLEATSVAELLPPAPVPITGGAGGATASGGASSVGVGGVTGTSGGIPGTSGGVGGRTSGGTTVGGTATGGVGMGSGGQTGGTPSANSTSPNGAASDAGCGCRTTPARSEGAWSSLGLLFAGWVARRRRIRLD